MAKIQLNKESQLHTRQSLASELSQQVEAKKHTAVSEAQNNKDLHNSLNGLKFECYVRDGFIKEQEHVTGQAQVRQQGQDEYKKHQDVQYRKQVSESHLTDSDLAQLRSQAAENN